VRWGVRSLLGSVLLATSCSGEVSIQIEPAWPEDRDGVMLAIDLDGQPIGPPIAFHGRTLPLTWFETNRPFRIWVDTYARDAIPELFDASCTLGYTGQLGDRLEPGAAYESEVLDPSEPRTTTFGAAIEPRPVEVFLHCPPGPDVCADLSLTDLSPRIDSDLHAVAVLDDDALLIGGIAEQPRQSFLGRIDPDRSLTTFDLGARSTAILHLAIEPLRAWASTSGLVIALGSDGRPSAEVADRIAKQVGYSDTLGLYALDRRGQLIRLTDSSTAGIIAGDRVSLQAIAAAPDRIYAHDGASLSSWNGSAWAPDGPPASTLADYQIVVQGAKVGLFGPAGVWTRDDPLSEWRAISTPNPVTTDGFWRSWILVSTAVNTLELWDGDAWCVVTLPRSSRLNAIAISRDDRRAIAVGSNFDSAGDPLVIELTAD
jgi:hypothetical protein